MTYYNWEQIVKNKTDKELLDFLNNSYIDTDGTLSAIDELKRRKFKLKSISEIGENMIEKWNQLKIEESKSTFRETTLKFSPYATFFGSFYVFIQFILSHKYSLNNPLLIGTAFLLIAGIMNIFLSKVELRRIQKKRKKKITDIDNIIQKITSHNTMLKSLE